MYSAGPESSGENSTPHGVTTRSDLNAFLANHGIEQPVLPDGGAPSPIRSTQEDHNQRASDLARAIADQASANLSLTQQLSTANSKYEDTLKKSLNIGSRLIGEREHVEKDLASMTKKYDALAAITCKNVFYRVYNALFGDLIPPSNKA